MLLQKFALTVALAGCTLAPVASSAASVFGHGAHAETPSNTAPVKAKMVKFNLANKTASAMTVIVNNEPMTLAANSSTPVRVALGSDITNEDRSTVKLHVTGELSGNTVSFR